ncbi:class I SAM-dependent DNA methyltransferase [Nannocystaceae bacterium ST9]
MSDEYDAGLYAAVHDGNPGDVEFYRARCAGARSLLELGCGDARVLAGLREPGRTLVGVDIDGELLELARARAGASTIEWVHADMADPNLLLGRRFDRVVIPHGGLYCLLDDAGLVAALTNVARLLAPGGLLILDAWAADGFHRDAEPDDQSEGWLERVKTIELEGDDWEVLERSRWDKPAQRLDVTYLHVRVGDEEAVEGLLRQRYLTSDQLRARLSEVGLEPIEFAGGFAGEPWDDEAELMVVIARRPE